MLETIKEFLVMGISIVGLISVMANVILMLKKKKVEEAVKLLGTTIKEMDVPDKVKDKVKTEIKEAAEKLGIEGKLNKIYTKFIKNDVYKKLLETKDIWTAKK